MASVSFRWLDILEKEFDKAFVGLDLTIGELDSEEPDVVYNVRQKLCTLSSCFAQLTHKAQTIFQNCAKIEAELIHMRAELVDCKSKKEILEQELHNLLLQLHSIQLSKLPAAPNGTFKDHNFMPDVTNIKKKLEDEMRNSPNQILIGISNSNDANQIKCKSPFVELTYLKTENNQLQQENTALRKNILTLNSDVYGAKLAAKYLDKELAGRIQQLQLLGREMRGDVRDKLWRQLESEILLQRHKTVVRECRRNSVLNVNGKMDSKPSEVLVSAVGNERTENFGDVRTIVVKRKPGQGLGISITGGREHGVPILISELEPNGPAALSGQLYIGDAILSVNERDLRQACHKEAVDILKQHSEECRLKVQYIAADDSENSLEDDGFHFRFFDDEVCDRDSLSANHPQEQGTPNTPTAPRTPEYPSQTGSDSLVEDLNSEKFFGMLSEAQRAIDSLQANDVTNHNLLINTSLDRMLPESDGVDKHDLNKLLDSADDYKKLNNLHCSTNSLNSGNLSSPMQTSTDIFLDSEALSTDDSHSPKNNEAAKFAYNSSREEIYVSNDTFSYEKSDQSFLNTSSDSSPIHQANRDYKKSNKQRKSYFGVKTLQSIFNKHDGYSNIKDSVCDEIVEKKTETKPAEEADVDPVTYEYKTVLPETSPQFEENLHNFLSDIFMKNFQTPEHSASTSKMGAKRYLRVGKALRLCTNEENANNISEYEQRREKLLARYVYNSNSVSADGEGNPDFGTPV